MDQFYFNLNDYLDITTQKYQKKEAIIASKCLTYNELYQKVILSANLLAAYNIKKGDRVIVCIGNQIETIILFWAVLRIGGVVSIVSPELSINKINYIINDSGAKLILSSKIICMQLINEKLDNIKYVYYENLFDLIYKFPTSELQPCVIDNDLASIIYTSGSTGEPKGVVMTHKNMLSAASSIIKYLKYSPLDTILCVLPLSFDYGLYQMIMSIAVGATLILEKNFTLPLQFLKNIEKYKVTVIPLVPSMVPILVNFNLKFKNELSSVHTVTNTGAALNIAHIREIKKLFQNANIFSMYGLTECKRCTYLPPEYIDIKPNSVGIAIPNTELWIVDEHDNILGPNKLGQLVIRGSTIMQGYWNKPELTKEKLRTFNNEKVFYTGDLCYLDEDGFLYFSGRMDEIIKSRGIKVSPKEIENVLMSLSNIKEAVVTSVNNELYGEMVVAAITVKNIISFNEVINYCKTKLELEKIPHQILFLEALPKSINGKYDKLAIKKLIKKTF